MAMMSAATKVLTPEDMALMEKVEQFVLTFDEVAFCSADRFPGTKTIFLQVGIPRGLSPARRTWLRGLISSRVEQQGWVPNFRFLQGSSRVRSSDVAESSH